MKRHNADSESSRRIKYTYSIMAGALAALLFYNITYYSLPSASQSVSEGVLPIFHVAPFPLVPIVGNSTQVLQGSAVTHGGLSVPSIPALIFALIVVFLGFGIGALLEPATAIIFSAPWLGMLLVFRNINFTLISQQYFVFVLAGVLCAAILGIRNFEGGHSWANKQQKYTLLREKSTLLALSIALPIIIYITSFAFLNLPNVQNQLFFQANSTARTDYSQLNYAISQLPPTGNLSVEPVTMPHVANRQYMEELEDLYIIPDYIVVDFNNNVTTSNFTSKMETFTTKLLKIAPYSLALKNGTAIVLERNLSAPVNLPKGVST